MSRRWWAAGAGVVLLAGLLPAAAAAAPKPISAVGAADKAAKGEELADYDSRTGINADAKSAPVTTSGVAALRVKAADKPASAVRKLRDALGIQGVVDIDKATGTPKNVAKLDGFLTTASKAKPEKIARAYLKAHSDVFGLSAAAVDALKLRQNYTDISGIHHLSFQQTVNGVVVFGNGVKANIAKDGRLISVQGSPIAALPTSTGTAKLTADQARAAAVANVYGTSKAKVTKRATDATKTTTFSDSGNAKLVMFQTAGGPKLAWETVAVDTGYIHVIDASTGAVMFRQSTVDNDTATVYPNYPGAPVGGSREKVSLSKWLPNNSPKLAGNVAHVYSDVNDDNVANPTEELAPKSKGNWNFPWTDFSAQVGGVCSAEYKCSWDPSVPYSWQTNRAAAMVQMYYFLGIWHDHLKAGPIGFTRAAGNFEAVDDDAVQGQAFDGADTAGGLPDGDHLDNANMNTPPDGTPPTMQMYLFEDPYVASHSADDPSIIFHEYTHGLSNRLVVDADGVSTLGSGQAGSMGEAWSDWYAMSYLVDQGLEKDTKTIGDVQEAQYTAAGSEFRSESLDCTVGAVSDYCPGTAAAGSGGYTYGDFGKIAASGAEVHADGEIWAQTLWDLRKAIGSKQSQSLVTRAMELSPSNPSYLDERNSILQADLAVNGGKYQKTIWKVFAHRGMGFFAGSVDGDDKTPVEDFSLPPAANTPRGSLTGKVTDSNTAAAVVGTTVKFGGHASGFADNWTATTDSTGKYTITGIIPGTYPKVSASGAGYDPVVQTVSIGATTNTLNWALRRDWAAASGGGTIVSFDDPDYTDFGCGPINLIDQSQGAGWGSDAELTGATGTSVNPKAVVIKLPTAVNVSELTINPANTCGDSGSASTGDYKLETSVDGVTWKLGSQGHFTPTQRVANSVPLATGSGTGIQYVRYTMLSTQVADLGGTCPGNYSGCNFMDSTELGVYGTPVA